MWISSLKISISIQYRSKVQCLPDYLVGKPSCNQLAHRIFDPEVSFMHFSQKIWFQIKRFTKFGLYSASQPTKLSFQKTLIYEKRFTKMYSSIGWFEWISINLSKSAAFSLQTSEKGTTSIASLESILLNVLFWHELSLNLVINNILKSIWPHRGLFLFIHAYITLCVWYRIFGSRKCPLIMKQMLVKSCVAIISLIFLFSWDSL